MTTSASGPIRVQRYQSTITGYFRVWNVNFRYKSTAAQSIIRSLFAIGEKVVVVAVAVAVAVTLSFNTRLRTGMMQSKWCCYVNAIYALAKYQYLPRSHIKFVRFVSAVSIVCPNILMCGMNASRCVSCHTLHRSNINRYVTSNEYSTMAAIITPSFVLFEIRR